MKVKFMFETPLFTHKPVEEVVELDDDTFDGMDENTRNDYIQELALDWAANYYGVGFEIVDETEARDA